MSKEVAVHCDHVSMSGAEGPVLTLGRWPILWSCDSCGMSILHDTTPASDAATPDTPRPTHP